MGEHNTLKSMRNITTASEVNISRAGRKTTSSKPQPPDQLCRAFAPSKFSETPRSWKEPNPASQPPRSSLQPVSENSNLSSPCVGRITKPKAKKKDFTWPELCGNISNQSFRANRILALLPPC